MAEKYYPTSPYAWCGNNPVRFVDPLGMDTVVFDAHGVYIDAFFHKDIKTGERKLDSKDDQQSIRMGYYYKKK